MNPLRRFAMRLLRGFVERSGRRTPRRAWADRLEANGRILAQRFAGQTDSDHVRAVLRHVIGIERWGQRRLQVALGEPFDGGGHRPFLPPDDASLDRLRVLFTTTRADTVTLARRLADAELDPKLRIRHDELGEVSVNGWLAYLDGHATLEVRRRLRSA